ncbi:NAD(P)-dependent oxidoreductase [Streptomyces sp. Rer75]|uniref:NAD-dependent epimerase/dehydratase family protein n=1 Tax=unclassified Streptomyces TaxID=2593676 RepID=UPI0015CFA6F1|nr:NAD(P)-dependent oxidoreductase [Streptomyces sp. Rer75]QLH20079.1 NAD(P)-dependent oxidoreductase [Streptomyces sp. Rer75]
MTFERILVTGGSGLIGRATVRQLVDSGASVTVLDRDRGDGAFDARVHVIEGDVTDPGTIRRAVRDQDAVVHLAGIPGPRIADDVTTYAVNTVGTYAVLSIAAECGVDKVVYASSINATGLPLNDRPLLPERYPFSESTIEDFTDPYSLSKKANEQAAAQIGSRTAMNITGIRFPLVRDITLDGGRRFAEHLDLLMRDDPRRAACEGWTYLDVTDSARAVAAALTHDTPAAPGILVTAPRTYLRDDTEHALARYAPGVARSPVPGRNVPVDLRRCRDLLRFEASMSLDEVAPEALITIGDYEDLQQW